MKNRLIICCWVLLLLIVTCQDQQIQKIEFVKDGVSNELMIDDVAKEKGYLLGEGEFSWEANKAIYGDKLKLKMKLSISEFWGGFGFIFGDNSIGFINEEDKGFHGLFGPAIGKTITIGGVFDHIKPDKPFNISVAYENKKLIYSIDGKELYSLKTLIPPAGLVAIRGELKGSVRVYEWICEGQFKSVKEFYTKEFLLDRAHQSVAAVAEKVKDDPNRPAYHFQPPANWNNDPNGMLFYDGYYHMFYQHNPYGDRWDWMHWGHARSKDMVYWEHLPIALWPSVEKGENHCFSGSGFIKDDGKPILFYTSIGHENPEHWAALPLDNQLKQWEKHTANPIIVMKDHGGQFIDDWRDPFLFREGNEIYMVIGGHPRGKKGSIMMYKALNAELIEWNYLGSPFEGEEGNWECPNFFKVGDKYVLIYSPHGQVEYYTGTMDFENIHFNFETHGIIDNGSDWNYYAPNTLQKEDGRRILFGWIGGFKENQGWQGAISLPRDLSIDENGRLIQKPVPELAKLRGDLVTEKNLIIKNSAHKLGIDYPQFEMKINVGNGGTDQLGFRFNEESGESYDIILSPQILIFGEEKIEVDPGLGEKIKTVQFFFDRTVIEIFINGGKLCATKVIYPDKENLNFEVFKTNGMASLESINIWTIKSIW
jgi:beta-fructofuranosidase